ncbi:unnamed protein product [Musa acuminata subsp. malaccensis]|uniref:(wild Malaysian banana) hypothetical protein n=1 Tax=Musa acuminata subsp. malaccensis TaxID=214687 RepID=A0A8D7BC01_MUSAM|nr:unnamed protein product [Musa acuminata subsp. malaccensis]
MPIPGILVRGKVRRDHGGEGVRASDIGGYGARASVLGGDGGGVPAGARGLVSPASKSSLTISPETPLASCRSWRRRPFAFLNQELSRGTCSESTNRQGRTCRGRAAWRSRQWWTLVGSEY